MSIYITKRKASKLPIINSLFIHFDGYNEQLYKKLMNFDGAIYDKKTQTIEMSEDWLQDVLVQIKKFGNIVFEDKTVKPTISNNSIPKSYKFKLKPYNHQIEGINYGLNHDKWLLLDDQGLGKTSQIIELADILKIKHCLIICGVNSLKYNWADEILKFSNLSYNVLDEGTNKKGKTVKLSVNDSIQKLKGKIQETFVITNREKLANKEFLKAFKSSKTKFDMIVVDECHKFKNPSSKSGRTLLKLEAKHMIALSGTMIMNSPEDSYVPLKWTGQIGSNFSQFKSYYNRYGGFANKEVVGHKNLESLQQLIESCSLRRMKSDVLDLPPKNFIDEYVDLTDSQIKLYNIFKDEIQCELKQLNKPITIYNELTKCVRLRQVTECPEIFDNNIESAKTERAIDLVKNIISQGDKVLVFTSFKFSAKNLYNKLAEYNPVICTGDSTTEEIELAKYNFNNSDNPIMIATHQKMSTGHTLSNANYIIWLSTPWTQAEFEQGCDRIYRIGQQKPCFIYTLITKHTYDERVQEILRTKANLSDIVLNLKLDN